MRDHARHWRLDAARRLLTRVYWEGVCDRYRSAVMKGTEKYGIDKARPRTTRQAQV